VLVSISKHRSTEQHRPWKEGATPHWGARPTQPLHIVKTLLRDNVEYNPHGLHAQISQRSIKPELILSWNNLAGCSAQSELFFRLLLKNTVRWVHPPAYPYFWIAPHGAQPFKMQTWNPFTWNCGGETKTELVMVTNLPSYAYAKPAPTYVISHHWNY
jgi:hypothetical protein